MKDTSKLEQRAQDYLDQALKPDQAYAANSPEVIINDLLVNLRNAQSEIRRLKGPTDAA